MELCASLVNWDNFFILKYGDFGMFAVWNTRAGIYRRFGMTQGSEFTGPYKWRIPFQVC